MTFPSTLLSASPGTQDDPGGKAGGKSKTKAKAKPAKKKAAKKK
jgi:hypothetical protein